MSSIDGVFEPGALAAEDGASAGMSALLSQLAALDQASTEEELDCAIPSLLESIGVLTFSDCVYIFESSSADQCCLENTFAWFSPAARSLGKSSVPQQVSSDVIGRWMRHFQRNEPIIIRDVEDLRKTAPFEYDILSEQGVRSLVAFPMFSGSRFIGFSGVDNPAMDESDGVPVVQLLSAVSGHLACLRENMRARKLLKENQLILQRNFDQLKSENALLDAMSVDYTAIYACDLTHDVIEMRREYGGANSIILDKDLPDIARCYSSRLREYFNRFVVRESCPDFLKRLSFERLKRDLEDTTRVAFRYQSVPNAYGQEHFEAQVTRIRVEEDEFRIVLGFRYMDDIVAEEEERKRKLTEALDVAQLNYEIISAISKIYWCIYRVDILSNYFEEISADEQMHCLTGRCGNASEIISAALPAVVSPESREAMTEFMDVATLRERLAARDSIVQEYQALNGQWHMGRFIVKKRDAEGLPTVVLYVASIIDEQKRREFEYRDELRAAADEARRANAAKTDFLRRMSHDIRTPINGIRGMVNIANHFPTDYVRQQDCRDKIWNVSSYLLSLVNSVLDMNKLESGDIMLDFKPFDLHALLHEIESVAQGQATEHGVTFVLEPHAHAVRDWRLVGSPAHVKQILLNLASNAVKYNRDHGEVHLSCEELEGGCALPDESAARSDADGPARTATFRFVCSDTGIGMTEAFQRRAFEPFTQEDRSDARTHYQGSGLGLSITKHLVDKMGGTISLESREGQGTTFTVELPFAVDADAGREDGEASAVDAQAVAGMRVLMAEDNDLNAEIAEFLLTARGIEVTVVSDGRQAVDAVFAAEPGTFDAVLMDIMMPVMNGLDATRMIRASKRSDLQELPIFAMSANAFTDDIKRSLEAGMNGHLTKPLEEDRIIAALAGCKKG